MIRNNPLIVASIVLGGVGVLLIGFASFIFLGHLGDVYDEISLLFGMDYGDIDTASICIAAVVFETAAFIFGYKALKN